MSYFDAENAKIEESKITDYLLALNHRVGAAKARFFISFGFDPGRPSELSDSLKKHAIVNRPTSEVDTGHGIKFVVEGPLASPDGRNPEIRSVWVVDRGVDIPRLVSAYPLD